MNLRPRGIVTLGLAVLVAIGVGVAVESNELPRSSPSIAASAFGDFAGYVWSGDPKSVVGQWRIPTVFGAGGFASTWIGVQSADGSFVQVGINEELETSNYDVAFWSDNLVHFHPQPVFDAVLSPGQLVKASIVASPRGWVVHLAVANRTTTFLVPLATDGFDQAEWTQEDPQSAGGAALPYPRVPSVLIDDARVNGRVPRLGLEDATWLSAQGHIYAPGKFANDSFTVRSMRTSFGFYQRQFLADVGPLNAVVDRSDTAAINWVTRPPSAAEALRQSRPYVDAASRFDALIAGQQWGSAVGLRIVRLANANNEHLVELLRLAAAEPHPSSRLRQTEMNGALRANEADLAVRSSLGLPAP